jgi:hypothetical protein
MRRTTLRNTTEIPSELVWEIIRFVQPPRTSGIRIKLQNSPSGFYSGRAGGHHCMVRFNPEDTKFPRFYKPYQYGQNKGKRWWVATETEMLVILFAHELRHCWQSLRRANRKGYAWGARGRYSEVDTEAYALRKLREWRRSH